MTYKQAKKLHKGDEVIEKKTGAILTVQSTRLTTDPLTKKPVVRMDATYENGVIDTFRHTEIM